MVCRTPRNKCKASETAQSAFKVELQLLYYKDNNYRNGEKKGENKIKS